MHTCEICGWTTNRISNLRAHHAKQKKCKPPPAQEPEPPPPITLYANQCAKCEKCAKLVMIYLFMFFIHLSNNKLHIYLLINS